MLNSNSYNRYDDLPLADLNHLNSAVYIIDYRWNYLFANRTAARRLNGFEVVGLNIFEVLKNYAESNSYPLYDLLKDKVEKRLPLSFTADSPVTGRPIEITGHALSDCYVFAIGEHSDIVSVMAH